MLCKKPFMGRHGCGQCQPCRINRNRIWSHRIMLESRMYPYSAFVSLSYSDEFVPRNEAGQFTLVPDHHRLFINALRSRVAPTRLRFYMAGEYGHEGERKWNPHFHYALFNYEPCWFGNFKFCTVKECKPCSLIREVWSKGRVSVGELTTASAQYVASYVTKKMTKKDDERLQGRHPEFGRQSNGGGRSVVKGGIGAPAVAVLADVLTTPHGCDELERNKDVPSVLMHGGKLWPLGRYIKGKLRERLLFPNRKTPEAKLLEYAWEERKMYLRCKEIAEKKGVHAQKIVLAERAQKVLSLETRFKIYKRKGSL